MTEPHKHQVQPLRPLSVPASPALDDKSLIKTTPPAAATKADPPAKRSKRRSRLRDQAPIQRHDHAVRESERRKTIESLDLAIPVDLPIAAHAESIVSLLRQRSTIVVSGETGSGKSTQLPKLCLAAGLGQSGFIGHTQPRRLAAQSIAARLAEELQTPLGQHVGFKIRFTDETKSDTLVKLMTDGILLAETQSDRDLIAYDAIIIDEAHERSLNIDFLLGYLKRLRERRPRLKTIITSATFDAERFAEHFADELGPAPIVTVEGRTYPVEIRYLPWEESDSDGEIISDKGYDLARHVIQGIDEIIRSGMGDILVFLPTERDIREVSHHVGGHFKRSGMAGNIELLPLYARLPQSEQTKIFHPSGKNRRVIFATNVAESSLTVPGIRHVVDTGLARISRYSPRSKMQRLPIEPISQASARQRAGRCGRVAEGICVRLYSQQDFDVRDAYTTPEIRRTSLASVILQTKVLRLGAVDEFPFLDPPRPDAVREGYKTLFELGAIDDNKHLTQIGHELGRLPVDPRVGRMIMAAGENGVLSEVLVIAAALEIQDPRERPQDKRQAADEAQKMFLDPASDFLSYLKLWKFFHERSDDLSRSQLQKACRQRFLSYQRMRQWGDVYRQLRDMVRGIKRWKGVQIGDPKIQWSVDAARGVSSVKDMKPLFEADRYKKVHQALLTGLLSGLAMASDKNEYLGAGNMTLFLWPGSGVFESKPKWIMAAELVETSKPFARCVARIQPEWIEEVAKHLVKRSYNDPHWSDKSAAAFCYEKVTLFGLPIVVRRRIPLAPIDPATARSLLIERGLVEQAMPTRARFVTHNRKMRQAIIDLAAKTRDRDIIIDPYTIHSFYEHRLPKDVFDRASLERWDREVTIPVWAKRIIDLEQLVQWLDSPPPVEPSDNETPYFRPEILTGQMHLEFTPADFPDALDVGETRLPLTYRFEPGAVDDGITVTIPKLALTQVSDERLGWLVPGLLEDKIVALIKALPKRIRRNLVPALDTAKQIVQELEAGFGSVPFMSAVCNALSKHAETPVTEGDFDQEKLPEHFRFNVRVVDDAGKSLAFGRSVTEVRAILQVDEPTSEGLGDQILNDEEWHHTGITNFDFENLPDEVVRRRGGVQVAQYPMLIDRGDSVDVRVTSDRSLAEQNTRAGLMRLFAITERKEIRSQVRWLPDLERSRMLMAHMIPAGEFEQQLGDLLARKAFVEGESVVRTRTEFDKRRGERGRRIALAIQDIAAWLPDLAGAIHAVRSRLEGIRGNHHAHAVDDVRRQVERLLQADFLKTTPWEWLQHYPRYFRGIDYRMEKLKSGAANRDVEATDVVRALWQQYEELTNRTSDQAAGRALEIRWLIEELRVSLFAQPLGTSVKVSPQRVEKLFKV